MAEVSMLSGTFIDRPPGMAEVSMLSGTFHRPTARDGGSAENAGAVFRPPVHGHKKTPAGPGLLYNVWF